MSAARGSFRVLWRRVKRRRKALRYRIQYPLVWLISRILPRSWVEGRFFYLWERHGLHVHRVHYYSPLPDTRSLSSSLFEPRDPPAGLDLREAAQLEWLERLEMRFRDEWSRFALEKTSDPCEFSLKNSSFGSVDAEMLYGFLRELTPRQMIEIGSGHSTLLAAQALRRNEAEGKPCHFTAIEPYPDAKLRRALDAGLPGLSKVLPDLVQDVPLATFEALSSGDVLFIDSSHIVRTGSDVNYEFLRILPCLAVGVWVHVHDIFLPDEYPEEWLKESVHFFNEQYLLEAFLSFNSFFQVEWTSHYLARKYPERLQKAFPSFGTERWRGGGSFWMRRVS